MNFNTDTFHRGVNFLGKVAQQDVISSSLKKGIEDNGIVIVPFEHFVRKDMSSAAGISRIVDNETEIRQGICTIDKGKLPSNEAFIATAVAISYGKGEKAGETEFLTKAPAALRNAELEITQGGRNVLSIPVASLTNPHTGNKVEDDFHVLSGFVYLGDDRDFNVSIKFPVGSSMPEVDADNKHYVELRLRGYKTAKRL